ncbi:MAG TPA: type II toxin-antitoxin system RelE/ParE family toxin [Candidatus Sulfotelmatobacter sp.]|nr:type II toxin-antitoxin system RelE/ParE family toxin [Candidatus Sulfotelmatobacter sp.]
MPRRKLYRLHPEAWLEFTAADDWYLSRSLDASAEFLSDVYEALVTISKAPQHWPKYLHGTRRFVLHRFPFAIIYLDDSGVVTIIAVAHSKRKPGYWKHRV